MNELKIICMKIKKADVKEVNEAVAKGYYLGKSEFMRCAMRNLVTTEITDMTYFEKLAFNEIKETTESVKNREPMVPLVFKITGMDLKIIDHYIIMEIFRTRSHLFRRAAHDEIDLYHRRKSLDEKRGLHEGL